MILCRISIFYKHLLLLSDADGDALLVVGPEPDAVADDRVEVALLGGDLAHVADGVDDLLRAVEGVRENLVAHNVVAKRGDGDAVNHHAVKLGLAVADGAHCEAVDDVQATHGRGAASCDHLPRSLVREDPLAVNVNGVPAGDLEAVLEDDALRCRADLRLDDLVDLGRLAEERANLVAAHDELGRLLGVVSHGDEAVAVEAAARRVVHCRARRCTAFVAVVAATTATCVSSGCGS